jgi:uncharacterized protein (DUF305 family)
MSPPRTAAGLLAVLAVSIPFAPAWGQHEGMQDRMQDHMHAADGPAPVFIASTAKPFPALMNDAMAVMDAGMARAPMNGNPDHDFVTMMLPHHQGAIDMARAVLLQTRDPALRNIALGIVAEQQNEINVMRAWLQTHPSQGARK